MVTQYIGTFISQRPHAAPTEIKDKVVHQQDTYPANLGKERCQAVLHPHQQYTQLGGKFSAIILLLILEAEGSSISFGDEAESKCLLETDKSEAPSQINTSMTELPPKREAWVLSLLAKSYEVSSLMATQGVQVLAKNRSHRKIRLFCHQSREFCWADSRFRNALKDHGTPEEYTWQKKNRSFQSLDISELGKAMIEG